MKLTLIISMTIILLSCFSVGYGQEDRNAMRQAILKVEDKLRSREKIIHKHQNRLSASIAKYLKKINDAPFPSVLKGIEYTDEKLCQEPDENPKSEDFLDLAMKFNQLLSIWYQYLDIQFSQRLKSAYPPQLEKYEKAQIFAFESFRKHHRLYKHYKKDLESKLRVIETYDLVPIMKDDGFRYQYVPHMIKVTNDLELLLPDLLKKIENQQSLNIMVKLNTAYIHSTILWQRENWMPKLIEYTARHLSESPDKYKRSKEYLKFACVYHKLQHSEYMLRVVEFKPLYEQTGDQKLKHDATAFEERAERHRVLHEKYEKALKHHHDSILSPAVNHEIDNHLPLPENDVVHSEELETINDGKKPQDASIIKESQEVLAEYEKVPEQALLKSHSNDQSYAKDDFSAIKSTKLSIQNCQIGTSTNIEQNDPLYEQENIEDMFLKENQIFSMYDELSSYTCLQSDQCFLAPLTAEDFIDGSVSDYGQKRTFEDIWDWDSVINTAETSTSKCDNKRVRPS